MGIQFGRYELLRRIAAGGMGEVYLARQAGLEGFEKLLVVKVLLPHLVENEEFITMFLDEARIAARLNHANVAQIFDLGEVDSAYYIAMEYIHGDDVKRIWRRSDEAGKPVPLSLAVRIAADAAAGLDYAHKATDGNNDPLGIVHRDVSPQNILVTFEGGVKIIDFGIARAANRNVHTATGTLKGKYPYMSPEQATSQNLDHRSDIFALGVVLYEMATNLRLFARDSEILIIQAVADCDVPRPSETNPEIDEQLEGVILKALAKNPDDRFKDAQEMRLALEDWLVQTRRSGSAAHLAAYLQDLYSDRLAEEREQGRPVTDFEHTPSGVIGRSPLGLMNRPATSIGKAETGGSAISRARGEEELDPTAVIRRPSPEKKSRAPLFGGLGALAAAAIVLFFALRPAEVETPAGHLTILTTPSQALVLLDGNELGLTPLLSHPMPADTRGSLEVRLEGYSSVRRTLSGGGSQQLEFTLERVAPDPPADPPTQPEIEAALVTLTIDSRPNGASVFLDGESIGTTPLSRQVPRSDEAFELRIERSGFRVSRQSVTPSEDRDVGAVLQRIVVRQKQEEDDPLDIKLGR